MTSRHRSLPLSSVLLVALLMLVAGLGAPCGTNQRQASGDQLFTSPQTNPIALSGDGALLFIANTTAHQVSVRDASPPYAEVRRIEVGLDPVSIAVRPKVDPNDPNEDELVVVANHVSDSISVIKSGDGLELGLRPNGVFCRVKSDGVLLPLRSNRGGVFVTDVKALPIPQPGELPLAPNPSFELDADSDSFPDQWRFVDFWGSGGSATHDGTLASEGQWSLRLDGTGGEGILCDAIPVHPGQRLIVQAAILGIHVAPVAAGMPPERCEHHVGAEYVDGAGRRHQTA